jgi:hypothetical protein
LKRRSLIVVIVAVLTAGCRFVPGHRVGAAPAPPPTPTPIIPRHGEVVIAAWAEPRTIARSGGQVQIVVRVQRAGDGAYPGVQVTTQADHGTLASEGRPLVTDADGMIHDRLTTKASTQVIVQVGDMRYRFKVALRAAP